uniref:Uncharacterized protein n=1 Tax=Tanacetum cinerariifolium TaxID=118510 RepID=A0A6L2L3M9_TANCI|nr:hypothetical protein [Tanacetum cinerariifolium]
MCRICFVFRSAFFLIWNSCLVPVPSLEVVTMTVDSSRTLGETPVPLLEPSVCSPRLVHMINEHFWHMSQFSLVSESNEKGEQFLFRWRYNEVFSLNSWAKVESLAEHLNIKLTLLVYHLKLIEIGLLDLGDGELELPHVDFWHISRSKDGLVESSVLDDVKDDLLWEPMPLHEQLVEFPLDS